MNITHRIAQNLSHPGDGPLGWLIGWLLAIMNRRINQWTVALLDVQPQDRVLEIGFGPGYAVKQVAQKATGGFVAGVDLSERMVQRASRLNHAAIQAGQVELRLGGIDALPYEDACFNTVFAINVIYFLPDPAAALAEVRRVLRPGGRVVLVAQDGRDLAKSRVASTGVFRVYSHEELAKLIVDAGFKLAGIDQRRFNYRVMTVIGKK